MLGRVQWASERYNKLNPHLAAVVTGYNSCVGVNAQSFIHSFTLTSSAFNVYLATPGVSF